MKEFNNETKLPLEKLISVFNLIKPYNVLSVQLKDNLEKASEFDKHAPNGNLNTLVRDLKQNLKGFLVQKNQN